MWPDDGIKSCPTFPNIAQKVTSIIFHVKVVLFKIAQTNSRLFVGYFSNQYFYKEVLKIAQSGHTAVPSPTTYRATLDYSHTHALGNSLSLSLWLTKYRYLSFTRYVTTSISHLHKRTTRPTPSLSQAVIHYLSFSLFPLRQDLKQILAKAFHNQKISS